MIKFVVPKPVKKIKRTYTPLESKRKKRKIWSYFFSIKIIWIIFWLFVLVYWSFLLLKNTIFDTQYIIKKVLYDSWDIQRYDEPYMYKLINNWIKNENYHVVKRYKQKILDDVIIKYPMVTDLGIDYRGTNTVFIKLTFRPLDLIIRNQDQKFAIVGETILPLYSGNNIANGIQILDLPEYLSGLKYISGLFFKIPAHELVQQVSMLYAWFSNLHHIEYLPWGDRSIVYLEGKKYYINNLWDISNQIRNYELLKKYYKDFKSLEDVDLWSLEKNKIIVRKF